MSTATFTRFTELPIELQIHIWEHAAYPSSFHPAGHYGDTGGKIHTLWISWGFRNKEDPELHATPVPNFFRYHYHQHPFGTQYESRYVMMGTSALARQVALEQWREDFMTAEAIEKKVYVRDRLLQFFEEEIQGTRSSQRTPCEEKALAAGSLFGY